ncbi:MAG: FtsX-like permease family protein [Campylobacterota bacterium]|nr:FtsX-like permease family protein [Campylobacterota bacterium]
MKNIIMMGFRNLKRSSRRTMLTAALITIGVIFVLVYSALSSSFKAYMVGEITDSMMGHIQIHKKGYIASVDNLPLDKNLNRKQIDKVLEVLGTSPYVESYTFRIKLGGLFSNYVSSTNIRLNAINPKKEIKTLPLFAKRIEESEPHLLKEGEMLIPELLAKGMGVKKGDTAVLVVNNKEGSVNGLNLKVVGIVEPISGPGGRDGYFHIEDAKKILRIEGAEVSEIVVRIKDVSKLQEAMKSLRPLAAIKNQKGKPIFEIHAWTKLSPFYNIVKMLDLMDLSIKIILISIVLISILNVMIMSVYERIKEIGTIAAMGTPPSTIVKLFLAEGFMLGLFGAITGAVISFIIVKIIDMVGISFSFGRQSDLMLHPSLQSSDVIVVSIIVIVIALIASISPALKAAKLNPVDALRQ